MSYLRVLPRDLFNEANLLKCLGQLWLLTEREPNFHCVTGPVGGFDIRQHEGSGAIYVQNIAFARSDGLPVYLFRPLNSWEPWPLYLSDHRDLEISVFDEIGQLSAEMKEFIR